jgi:stage II sporulation protein D
MASRIALLLLVTLSLTATELSIGVLSLFRPQRVAVRSTETLWIKAGSRTFFLAPGEIAELQAVRSSIDLSAQRQTSIASRVVISGRGGAPVSFRVSIEGKIDRYFVGQFEVKAVGSQLQPAIRVDLESAVAAVVAAEVQRDTPLEAMKAMSVLARSYYVASGRRHESYQFCDTTHCQWRRETVADSHTAAAATRATAGIVLSYGGRAFPAMYHASCGGRTKSAEEVGLSGDIYPYTPVECETCRRTAPTWIRHLTRETGAVFLKGASETHRLEINRTQGSHTLPSNHFKATIDSDVVLEGRGEGHGVGVCQRGIIALAGAGLDYRALLSRYLPQTRTVGKDNRFPTGN